MIQAFKHDENNVLAEMSLEQLDKGSWINCAAPSQEELSHLNELDRGSRSIPCRPPSTVKNVPTSSSKTITSSSS